MNGVPLSKPSFDGTIEERGRRSRQADCRSIAVTYGVVLGRSTKHTAGWMIEAGRTVHSIGFPRTGTNLQYHSTDVSLLPSHWTERKGAGAALVVAFVVIASKHLCDTSTLARGVNKVRELGHPVCEAMTL